MIHLQILIRSSLYISHIKGTNNYGVYSPSTAEARHLDAAAPDANLSFAAKQTKQQQLFSNNNNNININTTNTTSTAQHLSIPKGGIRVLPTTTTTPPPPPLNKINVNQLKEKKILLLLYFIYSFLYIYKKHMRLSKSNCSFFSFFFLIELNPSKFFFFCILSFY